MRIVLQPAFVLHQRPYRDSSLLLEALSRDYGRMGLVAKGVRRCRSRRRGLLQPFFPLLLSWSGNGELVNLTAVEEVDAPVLLPRERLLTGLYVNELLLRLLQRYEPFPELFVSYQRVLRALAVGDNEEQALRLFEKRLLAELGYGLILDVDTVTNTPIRLDRTYHYVLDRGPVPARRAQSGIEISGASLLALRFETLDNPAFLREIKRLTRAAINVHLQGRPLRTRQWLLAERRRQRNRHLTTGSTENPGINETWG